MPRQKDCDSIIFGTTDPWERLGLAIILSGMRDRDDKFFYSDWAATLFHNLCIKGDPVLYYQAWVFQHRFRKG